MNSVSNIKQAFSEFFSANIDERVCVIGGSNMDIVGSSLVLKKDDSVAGKISLIPGGIARNIAENLGRLKIPTNFISAIGDDIFGEVLNKSLTDVGVFVSGVRKIGNKNSGSYMILSDEIKELKYAINDMEILNELNRDWILNCKEIITRSKAVIIDCNLKHETLDEIFNLYNGKIYVNTVSMAKSLNIIPYLNKVWALNLNKNEAEVLSGIIISDDKTAYDAVRFLTDKGASRIAIEIDDNNLIFSDSEKVYKFTHNIDSFINVSGSTETFTAVWAALEYEDKDVLESIKNSIIASKKNSFVRENVNKNLNKEILIEWANSIPIECFELNI